MKNGRRQQATGNKQQAGKPRVETRCFASSETREKKQGTSFLILRILIQKIHGLSTLYLVPCNFLLPCPFLRGRLIKMQKEIGIYGEK
ncbi:MAG: hypothetical protein LBL13_05560 [Bacteroidales bacterium]|nr:hypothetical protein [Bacteroidales bacterium]